MDDSGKAPAVQKVVVQPISVQQARDRATLLHHVFSSTLTVMHDRYFHQDQVVIPARAMEDVFSDVQKQTGVKARWIAVSFDPMNINHEAEDKFEELAARQIAKGEAQVEAVENGLYRRATAIPFQTSCISCHAGYFRKAPTKQKFAGLVISIPVIPPSGSNK